MGQKHLIRYPTLVILVSIIMGFLAGCATQSVAQTVQPAQFEQWDHEITADEFSSHPTLACLVYKYRDPRFNDKDYFDMYTIGFTGISDFDSVHDETLGVFLYQPVYTNGSVSWLAHAGAEKFLTGTRLRFYHIWN
jgi:hypothetical protein